jgi:hypothetical protein
MNERGDEEGQMRNGEKTECERINRNMEEGDNDIAQPSPNSCGSRAATNTPEVGVVQGRQSRNSIAMERTLLLDGSAGPRYIGESTIRYGVPRSASPLTQWSLSVPHASFENSAFCPHSVFMCSLRFS